MSGKWCYGNLQLRKNDDCIITPDDTPLGTYGKVDRNTVGQYTGLKDKNGVEIYEGDIVKVDGSSNNDAEINEVVFYRGAFCFTIRKKIYPLFTGLNYCCEVIGNIYENPELLKESEE